MNNRTKSIVLVTVDCLRWDHVGFMGYSRPTTPFLDTMAAESFVVPSAIVAGAPTYYSLPGLMAARYPLALGRDVVGLAPGEPTLASVLKQAGYRTAAFVAGNPYISARFGYAQGFDTFRDFLGDEIAPLSDLLDVRVADEWASRLNRKLQKIRSGLGPLGALYDELYFEYCQRGTPVPDSVDALRRFPSADVVVDHACDWLSSIGGAPFFLWLHLMDPHAPYYPKQQALEEMEEQPLTAFRARYLNSYWNRAELGAWRLRRHVDDVVRLYDSGVHWVDSQMARLTETLRRLKRWDDCVFTLTADHGEEFLDHGGRYHPPSRLTEELIHVPLLLRVPGASKTDVGRSPFSLVHLAPTLLDAAQLESSGEFHGQSFWKEIREGGESGGAAIAESVSNCTNPYRWQDRMGPRVLAVRESRFKLIFHFDQNEQYLYDLDADPGEQAPLSPAAQKPVRRRLLEIAREHLKQSSEDRDTVARMRARLRDLRLEWTETADKALRAAS